jgi:Calx-beta domain
MNPRHLSWLAGSCAVWLAAVSAGAATYVMMADEDLADQAPVIAVVRVAAIEPARGARALSTDYVVDVERAVKGAAGGSLRVRVLGGTSPEGVRLRLFGMPRFRLGERALLFLAPSGEGVYGVVQAMLGAFHEVASPTDGRRLAVRDLSEAAEVPLPGRHPAGPGSPRDLDRFAAWLTDRAQGRVRSPDYFVQGAAPPLPEFTQLGNGRWFEFDSGGSVPWRAHVSGQIGMPGGGFIQFQSALQAWNNEPATPINLLYGGTTTASAPFAVVDGINNILWNDPNDEIAGSFDCATGGVLAFGGYKSSGTGVFNGLTFNRIIEGDIVTQDGAGCFFSGNGNEDGEEVFGHELGHTLGLGHSCGDAASGACVPGSPQDQALMRAFAHGDGRGAALGTDDQDGARYLYQPSAPTLFIADVTVNESDTTVDAVFTVSLSAASAQTVTVDFSTANGSALAGSDYTAASGTLTFPPGVLAKPLTVQVTGDFVDEPTESFFVNLSSPTGATIADGQATGTIVDNDPAPGISISDCAIPEGNAGQVSCHFDVSLSAPSAFTVSVSFATADGTATNGVDYFGGAGVVTFPAGSTSQLLPVAVNGDLLDEPDETYFVNLSSPVNATLADNQGVGTIVDDDLAPEVSVSDCSVTEGDAGQAICSFTVSLSAPSGQTVSVAFATADGTALGGQDYLTVSGTVTFLPGTTVQSVPVSIIGDLLDEPDESFSLDLSAPVNATIVDGQGAGTIIDNDAPPAVSVSDCAVVEGDAGPTPCAFTVSLSAPSSFTVSVSYNTMDGTATAGADYTAAGGTLTFAPGNSSQPVTVQVLGDAVVEADETFFVNLTGPVNATLGDAQGVGTIGDDDAPSLSSNELRHGSVQQADLLVRPDLYRIGQRPYSSYEVVIDGTSGDIVPVTLQRLAGDNVTLLQSAAPVAVGASVSLRWENPTSLTVTNQHVRVDGTCATPCGTDDVYRIRAFETTYAIPRFNNAGSQTTVLLLQNPAAYTITGHVWFWSTSGSLLGSRAFNLASRQTLVLSTATVTGVAGQGGTITVSHDGRYGDLSGKTVALEPSTGFSFDSPMTPRPR